MTDSDREKLEQILADLREVNQRIVAQTEKVRRTSYALRSGAQPFGGDPRGEESAVLRARSEELRAYSDAVLQTSYRLVKTSGGLIDRARRARSFDVGRGPGLTTGRRASPRPP